MNRDRRDLDEGGFENKPLAGLAGLRAKLPSADSGDSPGPPERPAPQAEGQASFGEKLVVQRERKKRGGKTVTRVRGLELDEGARAALAKELAKALGCGASVEGEDVLVQGDQVTRAADWLEGRGARRVVRGN